MLVFGMTVVGCDDNSTNSDGGTFTINNIPSKYDGKYAGVFETRFSNVGLIGYQSKGTDTFTLVQISNGRVDIPIWTFNDDKSFSRYDGNDSTDTNEYVTVWIFNKQTLPESFAGEAILAEIRFFNVVFSNGCATKSFGNGNLHEF